MSKLIRSSVFLMALALSGCHSGEKHVAQERLRKIFEGLTQKGNFDQAICLWGHGTLHCPGGMEDYRMTISSMEVAFREKGITAFDQIHSYEIGDATYERSDGGMFKISPVVRVRIKVNSATLDVRCIAGEFITWVECADCAKSVGAPSDPAPAPAAQSAPAVPASRPLAPKAVASPSLRPILDGPALFALVSPSVVVIETYDKKGKQIKQGSAVSVAKNLLVTNWHVVSKGESIKILIGKERHEAKVEAVLEDRDLVRLRTEIELPPAMIADAAPTVGETAFALGAPFGFELTISEGILSGKREDEREKIEYLQTTAAISPGSSGGGLFSARGELLGITTAQVQRAQNLNFALPSSYVRELMALPSGTVPVVEQSPLLKLKAPDRKWLTTFAAKLVNMEKNDQYSAKEVERARALIASLGAIEAWEKETVRFELGGGLIQAARAFWEDAVDARTFKTFTKSRKRLQIERTLLKRGLVTEADLRVGDEMMTKIADRSDLVLQSMTLVADERVIAAAMEGVARRESLIESLLWRP